MRVANAMISHSAIKRIGEATSKSFRLQEQISSGKRILRPSDEPAGAVHASALRTALAELQQYVKNAAGAKSLLGMTDSALGDITNLLRSARASGLAGANDTSDSATRAALAQSVNQILQAVTGDANSDAAGQFLFAGFKTTTSPFTLNAAATPPVTYNGDSGVIGFEVSRTSTVLVNLAGDQVFNMAGAADPAIADVFSTLANLRDALNSGNSAQMQNCVTELDKHLSRIVSLRADLGSRIQVIDLISNRLGANELSIKGTLSDTEDIDISQALIDLQSQQNVYQATVSITAMMSQKGLVDYLR